MSDIVGHGPSKPTSTAERPPEASGGGRGPIGSCLGVGPAQARRGDRGKARRADCGKVRVGITLVARVVIVILAAADRPQAGPTRAHQGRRPLDH